jgi:hypothetical protein
MFKLVNATFDYKSAEGMTWNAGQVCPSVQPDMDRLGFCVKLPVMRRRTSYFWAFGAFFAFLALLIFDGRPNTVAGAASGLSAPSAPVVSVDSAPAAKLLRSHFNGCGHALRSANLSLALRASRAIRKAREVAADAQPVYGPLHRRPPPSLS